MCVVYVTGARGSCVDLNDGRPFPFVQPIPVEDLVLEDVDDGEAKVGGSFRGSLSMSSSSKSNDFMCQSCYVYSVYLQCALLHSCLYSYQTHLCAVL